MTEEKLTVEDQKELYGAINAASAAHLRDGKLLQEKMTDVKQKPVVVRMYEELQEKSTAMLVNVEPDPSSKEIEDVRTFHAYFLSNIQSTLLLKFAPMVSIDRKTWLAESSGPGCSNIRLRFPLDKLLSTGRKALGKPIIFV